MISIDKSIIDKPKNLTYKPCLNAINEVIISKNGEKINSIYNSKKVKEQLLKLYNNKCAYCESKIRLANTSVRIDHYRPKDKVKNIDSEIIAGHNGYYWLGYEWTNLLPTCETCNTMKSNKFPVKNETNRIKEPKLLENNKIDFSKQILNSDFLKNENPLLLNPEIDIQENHFIYISNGEIKPISINGVDIEKSETTIKVCDLNRDTLIIRRKKKIDKIVNKLKKYLNEFYNDKNEDILKSKVKDIFEKMLIKTNPNKEFSRLNFFILQKIDIFIFSEFDIFPRQKQLIVYLFTKFKNGLL